jgi:hypothetical protein
MRSGRAAGTGFRRRIVPPPAPDRRGLPQNDALAPPPAFAAAAAGDPQGISLSGLDPALGALGVLIGLLTQSGDTYSVVPGWFMNPYGNVMKAVTQDGAQLAQLLAQLLGSAAGEALGVPVKDPAIVGTWYPIQLKDKDGTPVPTGLAIASYADPKASDTEVFGLGVMRRWELGTTFTVEAYGMIPFVKVGGGSVAPVLTTPGYPATLGIAVEAAGGGKLLDVANLSCDGVKVSATLDLAAASADASVVILQLQLPGEAEPKDRSLADLASASGAEIQATAAALFVGALAKLEPSLAEPAGYLLPLLGVVAQVPGADTELPLLSWADLIEHASDPGAPFMAWFTALASDPDVMKTWLGALAGTIGKATTVTGTGSRQDPLSVVLVDEPAVGTLSLTMASVVDADGKRLLYPGLAFSSQPLPLPGAATKVLRMTARAELAEFVLAQGVAFGSPADLDFSFTFALTDADETKPLAAADGYSFGALRAGVELSAAVAPVPHLSLTDVVTPNTTYPAIDLLSPGQLADVVATTIQNQLMALLGITPGSPPSFAQAIAALIGVVPPAGTDASWPAPPFSAANIVTSIQDPVGALAAYYRTALTTTVSGAPAFSYLLSELASAAQAGTTAVTVSGSGTPASPWTAALTGSATMPAVLTAYTQSAQRAAGPVTELVLGLALEPQLALGGTTIVPSLAFDLVSIDLPQSGSAAPVSATWAPRIAMGIALPAGFTSPAVGGVSFAFGPASISAAWNRSGGWSPSVLVTDPVVTIGTTAIPLGQSLDFSDPSALAALVTQEAEAFLQLVGAVIGLGLARTGSRAGIALAGIMGLLQDVSAVPGFPTGTWPAIGPFTLSGFGNPWPDLRAQLARDFATPQTGAAVTGLLAWAADASLTALPAIPGSGTAADPFVVPVGSLPLDAAVWYTPATEALGLGAVRQKTFAAAGISVVSQARLNALEYALATGTVVVGPDAPSLTIQSTVARTDGTPLVAGTADTGSLGSVVVGVTLGLDDEAALTVTPVVTLLNVTLPGEQQQAALTLADMQASGFEERLRQAFEQLVGAGLAQLIDAAKTNATFTTAYGLLVDLGLALAPADDGSGYGVNPGGWSALLADPAGFLATQFEALLLDGAQQAALFAFVLEQLGITLPPIPPAVLELLAALGFVGPAAQGYPLRLDALVALARNPLGTVATAFAALAADTDAVTALASELAGSAPVTFGPFTFAVTGPSQVSVGIERPQAAKIGSDLLELWGTLAVDLRTPAVGVDLHVFVPAVAVELVSTLAYRPAGGGTPAFGLSLGWGDGTRPAPAPLTLYPFVASDFLAQLGDLAPAYVLSTLATAAFESELLAKYPLVQKFFSGLGLAEQVNGAWQMPGLLGLLHDPQGWLLAEGVLGKNGKFDVAGFAQWLAGMPAVTGPGGIAVVPQSGGVAVQGLPYGVAVSLTGASGTATIGVRASGVSVAGGDGLLDLGVDVTLGPDYQPGVGGSVKATAAKLATPFTVEAAYAGAFALSVGQAGGAAFQLVPFQGWGSLVSAAESALPALVLQQLVPKLLAALKTAGAATFVDALESAGTDLNVTALVDALIAVKPVELSGLEDAALAWLLGLLQPAQAPKTATAVATLLQLVLPTVTASGGLVSYTPSASLPLTVLVGLDPGNTVAGLWLDIAVPASLLSIAVQRTGVGVPIAGGAPVFTFGASVAVPIEQGVGPALVLAYDAASGLVLSFDPLYLEPPGGGAPTASALQRELLPTFFPLRAADPPQSTTGSRVESWLLDVVTQVLPRYVAAIVLNESDVLKWLDTGITSGTGAPTPGQILVLAQLIVARTPAGSGYDLVPFAQLAQLTPQTFAANFLYGLLKTRFKLLSFGPSDDGQIWIGPNPQDATAFGVELIAPDFPLPGTDRIVLQLGATDKDWIAGSGGDANADPGVALYVPLTDATGTLAPKFDHMQIELVNVGVDFVGVQNGPLIDMSRFQLGGVSPRAVVQIDLNGGSPTVTFGGGLALDGVAISLAPNTLSPAQSGSNPVAQNLLGSGTTGDNNPPANPSFTIAAAYTKHVWVKLSSPNGVSNPVIFPVQRSFGPLTVDDVGVGWEPDDSLLDLLFDGSVKLAGLEADLVGLQVGIPVKTLTNLDDYRLDLHGLDISFNGGGVTITGGFLKTTNPLSYTGAALVQAAKFGLTAIGSYAVLPAPTDKDPNATAPSMFIFGALSAPLGGVPAFFITGVAAGFGYNRSLKLPDVGDVQNFPLVAGVLTGKFSEGTTPADAIAAMGTFVAPSIGDYWLAAGLKFTSFQLIDAIALLFLQFGRHVEIDLIGLASAPLPKGVDPGSALAYVELALKASIQPDEGIISVQAQLTPNSYVITKDCKLTGGFAFFLWLKDITVDDEPVSAGDFVISLGGYHPAFKKPAHYPDVPRLGFSWQIDAGVGTVNIGGGAYFALVPTAVMCGGYLNVDFVAGPLHAWLSAAANFLIEWAPFFFEVDIAVSIGASFGTTIAGVSVTLSVELGADLMLTGPPTHGHAHVSWYVISFTIPFGSGDNATNDNTLEWEPFAAQFLPPAPPPPKEKTQTFAVAEALAADPPPKAQPLKATVQTGRLGGPNGATEDDAWIVQAVPFALRVETAIPTPSATVADVTPTLSGPGVGVRPMGVTASLQSPLVVTILDPQGKPVSLTGRVTQEAVTNAAAGALWSKDALSTSSPPDPATMLVPGALMGVVIDALSYLGSDTVPAFAIATMEYQTLTDILLPFANPPQYGPAPRYTTDQQNAALALLMSSIMAAATVARRNAAFATLRPFTTVASANPSLSVMASSANLVVQAPPTLARPGVFQVLTPPVGAAVAAAAAESVPAAAAPPPRDTRLIGTRRIYRSRVPAPAPLLEGLATLEPVLPHFVDEAHGVRARAHVRALGAQPDGVALHPGSLAIWAVDDNAAQSIEVRGDAPLRATCIDRHGEAIADVYDIGGGAHALPAGTGLVAVEAYENTSQPAGWQIDTTLVRVNRYYALGPGCLVRVQNVHGLRSAGQVHHRGLISGSALIAGNLVTGARGALVPGWIQTVLPAGADTFSVSVVSAAAGTAPDVRVLAERGPRPGRVGADALVPLRTHVSGAVTVLVYAAPPSDEGGASLTIITRPLNDATQVVAVYAGEVVARDGTAPLPRSAVDLDRPAPPLASRVTLVAGARAGAADLVPPPGPRSAVRIA